MNQKKRILWGWGLVGIGYVAIAMGCAQIWDLDREFVLTDDGPNTGSGGNSGGGGADAIMCGNGLLEAGEACDDGNHAPNDGCTGCVVDECYTCTNEAGELSTCIPAMAGVACQSTKVCDGASKCVECVNDMQCNGGYCFQTVCAKCDDTQKNGDETDVDCGGTYCPKCTTAKTCGIGGDCESTFCTDGVCCADACDGACLACNIAGSEGTCDFIAKYAEDPIYGTGMSCKNAEGKACNGGGLCGAAVGEACQSNTGCASGKCSPLKVCVKNTGEDCTMNAECLSNACDPGTMKCM